MNFIKQCFILSAISLLCFQLLQCDKTECQYWDNKNIKVKEVKNFSNTVKYFYNENGKLIIKKIKYKNGSSTTYHYSNEGNIDSKAESDKNGITNEYLYEFDGTLSAEETFDETGLILLRNYSDGILVSEEHYFNKMKHGLCSEYYCQDGSLKYQCIFKDGKPFDGIWSFSSTGLKILDKIYYKYSEGKKEKIDFKQKNFPYTLCYYYNAIPLEDSIYRIGYTVHTSTTTCARHSDGEFTLMSAKIINYDSSYIKLIGPLTFKVFSAKPTWILLAGLHQNRSKFLDSICITTDSTGILLRSEIEVKPETNTIEN